MRDASIRGVDRVSWWTAMLTVAATYFYFLIFAEFAFLELANNVARTTGSLRLLMLGLGAGGVIGAAIAAWGFRTSRAPALLAWTLRACAISAAFAWAAKSFATVLAAGVVVGVSLGALTVVLASSLRGATRGRRLGLCIGAGTGLAYALCNLPWLFRAPAPTQTILATLVVSGASFLPRWMAVSLDAEANVEHSRRPGRVVQWLIILLALVWMDSAAFYIIQHTAGLQAATWHTTRALLANASIHLCAALFAGSLLDRGWRHAIAAMAVGSLAVACLMLNCAIAAVLPAAWFYTAGVSLYSTILVEFPARDGRAWVAAVVFAVAGWIGSALGIGMAQDLATVPVGFVAIAVVAVAVALMWRTRSSGRAAATIAVGIFVCTLRGENEIAMGREVYIAEGCIHCHSQFVRPNSARDVERWGPASALEEALHAAPPLFGARRLGPDLSHVGNRRTAEWNRLHLIAPQSVSPGSRMPSYAHLFRSGDPRGEALVAYLASLGSDNLEQRWTQISGWKPHVDRVIDLNHARTLFVQLCAHCHGEGGRGDGALAGRLSLRPPDWTRTPWRHVTPDASREVVLSRIIKFGLPGLPMAGHEYLPDAEIVGLARFVQTLHNAGGGGPSAAVQP
jgi:cytochrome c oxidase cbb3-type subunit 2